MPRGGPELERALARLHQGPPAGLVAARRALAAELRAAGRAEDAAAIAAVRKPPISASAVSALFAREPRAMRHLLAEGEAARDALARTIAGGAPADLRGAIERVRRAGATLLDRALEIAGEQSGRAPGAAIARRIETNLSALALGPAGAEAAARGWIDRDLDPPGTEILASLARPRPASARRAVPAGGSPRGALPGRRPPAADVPARALRTESVHDRDARFRREVERVARKAEAARARAEERARRLRADASRAEEQAREARRRADAARARLR